MCVDLINCLNTSDLIILSLTWTWSIVWKPHIWSFYPFLFICPQDVHELGQLFGNLWSSQPPPLHPSPGCTWSWSTVWIPLFWLSYPFSSSVSSSYINLGQLLKTSSLAWCGILPHPLHPSPGSMWTWSIVWIPVNWSSYSIYSSIYRKYVDLIHGLKTAHLIIPSHLCLSPRSTQPCQLSLGHAPDNFL